MSDDLKPGGLAQRLAKYQLMDGRPPLLRAVHKLDRGCGKIVAVFYDYNGIGWDRRSERCQCPGPKPLPDGDALDQAVRRARAGGSPVVKV
jgi:hypothetical protein